jgi:RHS repeat-associated protein
VTRLRSSNTDGTDTTYAWDAAGQLTQMTAYTHDPGGNLTSIRSSNAGGVDVEYAWDAAGQLTTVTDRRATPAVATHAYSATGQMTSATLPTGVQATYGRDRLDRVTGLSWRAGAGSTLASYAYTLGASGHRLSMVEASGRRVDYRYDDAHRLVGETVAAGPAGTGTIGYVLDPTGNRLERTSTLAALPAATYAYDANDRLTSDGWDANGNATTCTAAGANAAFTYDHDDRLVTKDAGTPNEVRLVYDGDGVLVGKTAGGVTTRYLVDDLNPTGLTQVMDETTLAATADVSYTWGASLLSQSRRSGSTWTTSHYGHDAHGNVTFLTDGAGAVTDTYSYDAWGNVVASTGATVNAYRYQGQRWDEDLGLYHLRARYYEPGRGRFMTGDPAMGVGEVPLSWNRYLYGNADAVNLVDPTGHFASNYGKVLIAITVPLAARAVVRQTTPIVVRTSIGLLIRYRIVVGGGVASALGVKTHCALQRETTHLPLQAEAGDIACKDELKSCATVAPGWPICGGNGYDYESKDDALKEIKRRHGKHAREESIVDENKPYDQLDHPCEGGPGYHSKVSAGGRTVATIRCCPCCVEPGVKSQRCRIRWL